MSRQIPVLSETETDSETTVYYVIGAILYRTLGIILPAPQWVHLPREPLSNIFIAARHRKAFQSESFRLILSVSFILPLNISSSPTSFISRQLFISFEFACLNPHSPPFYFSLLLSLLPHNASTASHSYLPPRQKKATFTLGAFHIFPCASPLCSHSLMVTFKMCASPNGSWNLHRTRAKNRSLEKKKQGVVKKAGVRCWLRLLWALLFRSALLAAAELSLF